MQQKGETIFSHWKEPSSPSSTLCYPSLKSILTQKQLLVMYEAPRNIGWAPALRSEE